MAPHTPDGDAVDIIAHLVELESAGHRGTIAVGPYAHFLLVSALQLATRNTSLALPTRDRLVALGRQLMTAFGGEALTLLERGWHVVNDVDADGHPVPPPKLHPRPRAWRPAVDPAPSDDVTAVTDGTYRWERTPGGLWRHPGTTDTAESSARWSPGRTWGWRTLPAALVVDDTWPLVWEADGARVVLALGLDGDDWARTAYLDPPPKGYVCGAGCQHSIGNHREAGCDENLADGGICPCTAPYGRLRPEGDPA